MATSSAQQRPVQNIEFIVKPREDLYLGGTERTLLRVPKGEPYPCQMQKTQSFSCLFRHYAKHNGLKKEDLVFYFVDELRPDEMPESVHLMPHDEIWVEHRSKATAAVEKKPQVSTALFGQQFRSLLRKGSHADVTFVVGEEKETFEGHKVILSARSEFFEAMFRPGCMRESCKGEINMESHDPHSFRRMLEFIYSGAVEDLEKASPSDVVLLLEMAHHFLLVDLARLCEHAASKMVCLDNIGRFMVLCARYESPILRSACTRYVSENSRQLRSEPKFRKEIEDNPELGLLILDASAQDDDDGGGSKGNSAKRRRITEEHEMVGGVGSNHIGANAEANHW
jgi:hypothetical protein